MKKIIMTVLTIAALLSFSACSVPADTTAAAKPPESPQTEQDATADDAAIEPSV